MNRRQFVGSSLAASLFGGSISDESLGGSLQDHEKAKPEYYELRQYHLRRGPQVKAMHDFFSGVALPAMTRNGLGPIGVFEVLVGPDSPTIYMLLPHKSIESFATASSRVNADQEYQKNGASFLNVSPNEPAYTRIESSLMVAFDSAPKLEVPAAASGNKPRIFELRTYESHSKKANKKKIDMFNNGEIAIFRRTGVQPVFFGETLIGSRLPNLTYMVTFENLAAREKAWAAFGADPEWKKLSSAPGYGDGEIVSNITNVLLRPTPYSQI
jgi:NIPSNAP protein